MRALFLRLLRDEDGQDIVEYVLLTAFIGLTGVAAFPLMLQAMGAAYQAWEGGMNSLWETPAPSAGS
jgi:Flp pilus assembly pilin Flp